MILCGGIVLFVVLAILSVMIWKVNQQDKKKQAYLEEYTEKLRPWESKRDKIEQELTILDNEYKNYGEKTSTLTFLPTELDERVYTEIYPQMKSHGFSGTLVFSPDNLPGMKGKITIQQFQSLQEDGWTTCVSWDGKTEWNTWMEPMQDWFATYDMRMPDIMYLTLKKDSDALNEMLMEQGYQTVICSDGLLEDDVKTSQDFWSVWSCGWLSNNAGDYASALAGINASLVFCIGFTTKEEQYEANVFEKMMKKVELWQSQEKFVVSDLTQARTMRQVAEGKQSSYFETYIAKKQELETQLSEVEMEIKRIEATYDWDALDK